MPFMRRCLSASLLLFLLCLAGCTAAAPAARTDLSLEEIAQQSAASQTQRPETLNQTGGEDDLLRQYLDIYGVAWEEQEEAFLMADGMNWRYPFLILILLFPDGASPEHMEEKLLEAIENEADRYDGIIQERALYVESHNKVLICPPYAAAVVCQEPEQAQEAFFSCFTGGERRGAVWTDEAGTLDLTCPYVPPEDAPDALYDTGPVLAAWETGDVSGLDGWDREIYEACLSLKEELFCPGRDSYETELAVHDWLLDNVSVAIGSDARVDREENTPYGALVLGRANCVGFSTTFQLLMELAGEACITVPGASSGSERFHAWNMVNLDGVWYFVDSSWNAGRPWPYAFFNVSGQFMAQTGHQWEKRDVPSAERDGPRPA